MRTLMTRLLVSLALCGAFATASATELRHGAGDSTTDDTTTPADSRPDDSDIDTTGATSTTATTATRPNRKPVPVPARAASDTRTMPARFHSFLPGMFR